MPVKTKFDKRWLIMPLLLMLYAGAGYLGVPHLVGRALDSYDSQLPDATLSVRDIRFNPWRLALTLDGPELRVDGDGLVAAEQIEANIAASSLLRSRTLVFDRVRVEQPVVELTLSADGEARLISAATPPSASQSHQDPAAPVRVLIDSLVITQGRIGFADRGHPEQFSTFGERLNLTISDLDTGPEGGGQLDLAMRPEGGGQIKLDLQLKPGLTGLTAQASINQVSLEPAWRYRQHRHGLVLQRGVVSGDLEIDLNIDGASDFTISSDVISIADANFGYRGDSETRLTVAELQVRQVLLDSEQRLIQLGEVLGRDGRARAVREADGRVDWLRAREASQKRDAVDDTELESEPWRQTVAAIGLQNIELSWLDRAVDPQAQLVVTIDSLQAQTLSLSEPIPLTASLDASVASGGRLHVETLREPTRQIRLAARLEQFFIPPVTGYLTGALGGPLTDGRLAIDSTAEIRLDSDQPLQSLAIAQASIDELSLAARFDSEPAIRLGQLRVDALSRAADGSIRIGGVHLNDPVVRWVIAEDGQSNQPWITETAGEDSAELVDSPDQSGGARPTPAIQSVTISGGELLFEDRQQSPAYATALTSLSLEAGQQTAAGPLELKGNAVGSGGANIAVQGDVDLANGALHATVRARGFDLVSMTGYSERYLGYQLDSGQADIDLSYSVAGSELDGKNKVAIQDFALGQAVDSEDAIKVPLKLAIALLQGPGGGIDLNVPVSGDLDDPEFSVGGIVVQAFVNLIIKAAASPFLVLGALIPDGGDSLDQIDFAPGKAELELASLDSIADLGTALEQRPALVLRLRGLADPVADRQALQNQRLESAIAGHMQTHGVQRVEAVRQLAEQAGLPGAEVSNESGTDSATDPVSEQAWLTALRQAIEVADADLLALARDRSEALIVAFSSSRPALADRVLVQDALIRDAEGDRIGIEVDLDVR